jgi:glycosyltransferase involved in cell wall biosynthesis
MSARGSGVAETPALSVVIPAHEAATTIGATLEGLAEQRGAGPIEVIVVDDGSADATAAIAAEHGARVIRRERGGPAAARAEGVEAAASGRIAFLDADCRPEPDWARAGLGALAAADLVQGRVRPDPESRLGPFDRTLWVDADVGLYQTANVFMTRDAYERAGGFTAWVGPDGDSRGHFGEDVLLGWAARRAGARATFEPGAVVRHAVFPRGPREYASERRRLAYFPELVRRVPELRRAPLFGRLFLTSRTAALDLAVVSLLVAALRRRPLAAVAAVPYAWRLVHDARARARERSVAVVVAADLAADLVGLASLVRGSVASRSPVL